MFQISTHYKGDNLRVTWKEAIHYINLIMILQVAKINLIMHRSHPIYNQVHLQKTGNIVGGGGGGGGFKN